MSGSAAVGWCPGALRPMESGDGLILRLKPSGGRLSLGQVERVARLAARDGNGQLDLTSRANLQIRGVAPARLDRLTDDLRDAGLLDGSVAAEAARNLVVSPLAGLDPTRSEIQPAVRALERRLAEDARLQALHPRWCFALDDGGALPLTGLGADVLVLFDRDGAARVRLDGVAMEASVAVLDLPDRMSDLGHLLAGWGGPARMRDIAVVWDVPGRLGWRRVPRRDDYRAPVATADLLGNHATFVGFAPAFGSMPASALRAAVDVLRAAGAEEVRFTPWKTVLCPRPDGAAGVVDALAELGLIVSAGDPRLAVSACVGAPACHRATVPTRLDAARLAGRAATHVHVAGCGKGCGQTAAAAWTLVGRDGRYDVVADGTARDAAVARGLSFPEAAAWISRAGHARMG